MTWTQSILDDEKNFPQKIGVFIRLMVLSAEDELVLEESIAVY